MKERGILMSGPMAQACFEGTKTQTLRVIKPEPPTPSEFPGSTFGLSRSVADEIKVYSLNEYDRLPKHPTDFDLVGSVGVARDAGYPMRYRCPYGGVGDRLWVRETWTPVTWRAYEDGESHEAAGVRYADESRIEVDAVVSAGWQATKIRRGLGGQLGVAQPALFMPRWASRTTADVTGVRAHRVQAITEAQCRAEGCSVEMLAHLTEPTARKMKTGTRHWLQGDADDGETYCGNCIESVAKKARAEIDGGWAGESDRQEFCGKCGVPIDGSYTDYGVKEEIVGLEDCGFRGPVDRYIAWNLATYHANEENEGRLTRLCYQLLWDSINAKPKPIYEAIGDKKLIVAYVSYPWEDVREIREHRGKPWHVRGNPWVWAVSFKKIEGGAA